MWQFNFMRQFTSGHVLCQMQQMVLRVTFNALFFEFDVRDYNVCHVIIFFYLLIDLALCSCLSFEI